LNREIEFWIVAKDGERIVGCMGIKKDNYNYRYLHIVVHPDYRSQSIGNNIRYMAIKFCMDDGAKIVSFMKEDNQFSHERFKEIGFQEQSRFGEYTYYLRNVKDLELGKLRKIWKNITG
jgi:N-acetylglutamate synthase-like GNAT family acetyltransferase